MSERNPFSSSEHLAQQEVARPLEITERPEYTQAVENIKKSGDLIVELLKLGVPESEVKPFARARLEGYVRKGYGLETLKSMAKQAGLISEAEVETLFQETKAAMSAEPSTETEEEKAAREARELEEMLAQYE